MWWQSTQSGSAEQKVRVLAARSDVSEDPLWQGSAPAETLLSCKELILRDVGGSRPVLVATDREIGQNDIGGWLFH